MKLKITLLLLTATLLFPQITNWQKVIPETKVAIQYYSPERTGSFLNVKNTDVKNTDLGSSLTFSNEWTKSVLTFRYYENDIELAGEINNLTESDLCLTLKIVFPLKDKDSLSWNNDMDNSFIIQQGKIYSNYVEVSTTIPPAGSFNAIGKENGGYGDKIGTGQMSFYPLASVSTASVGYGVGLDLSIPLVYHLSYNPDEGLIAEFDLALTSRTTKFPNRSFFKLQLFEHDPGWHFRSALKKYYEINPDQFKKRVAKEGIWLPFTPLHSIKGWEDFGFAFHETDWRAKDSGVKGKSTIEADRNAGVYSFQYTEPWDIQIPIKNLNADYNEVISDRTIPAEHREYLKSSATLDKNNLWQTRKLETPWFESGWAVSITTNVDPEITNLNRYQFVCKDEINPSIKMNVDGIYFDSMEWNWHHDLNYNTKHFEYADYPLTFSSSLTNPKPAIWNYSSEFEMMKKVADEMHAKGKFTMGNGFGFTPFAPGILDLFGAELSLYSKGDADKRKLQFNRAISTQKPIVFLLNEGLNDKVFSTPPYNGYIQYFEKMLFYGFFPSFFSVDAANDPYWQDSTRYNIGRPFFKKYIPVIKEIAAAGWEPVTYLKISSTEIAAERFGDDLYNGLYFTLKNESTRDELVNLSLNTTCFNEIDFRNPVVEELLDKKMIETNVTGNEIKFNYLLPANSVRVIKISGNKN
ncbi:MAG: hypothetical protein C4539_17575 [Ignavibacteriales bacterium]|nr:MAG: hypothetical protein C4539_17575 [Ignavibacteriales bacterium]